MRKTKRTEITKVIKKRLETNREKPKPKKTSETCRLHIESHNFGAPGHHFDVILASCWGCRRSVWRLRAPSGIQCEPKPQIFQIWSDTLSPRHAQESPGDANKPTRVAKGVPKGSKKQPKSETNQISRNLDFGRPYGVLN